MTQRNEIGGLHDGIIHFLDKKEKGNSVVRYLSKDFIIGTDYAFDRLSFLRVENDSVKNKIILVDDGTLMCLDFLSKSKR